MCAEPRENSYVSSHQPVQAPSCLTCPVIIISRPVSLFLLLPFVCSLHSNGSGPFKKLSLIKTLLCSTPPKGFSSHSKWNPCYKALCYLASLALWPSLWHPPFHSVHSRHLTPSWSWAFLSAFARGPFKLGELPDCILELVQLSPHFGDSWPL